MRQKRTRAYNFWMGLLSSILKHSCPYLSYLCHSCTITLCVLSAFFGSGDHIFQNDSWNSLYKPSWVQFISIWYQEQLSFFEKFEMHSEKSRNPITGFFCVSMLGSLDPCEWPFFPHDLHSNFILSPIHVCPFYLYVILV